MSRRAVGGRALVRRHGCEQGARIQLIPVLLVLVADLGTAGGAFAEEAPGPRLEAVIAGFSAMPGLEARFREEKHVALLRAPLSSHGVLYYAAPHRLARHVVRPARSALLVDRDRLSYQTERDRGEIELRAHPGIEALLGGIRLLLRGDLDGLRKLFRIEFGPAEPQGPRWKLRLEPLGEPLRSSLESILVTGEGRTLYELRVSERNGDETRTFFSDVDSDRRFTEAEMSEFFQLPGP